MLLKGGYVVNSDRKYLADVLIENNVIKLIGVDLVPHNDAKVINVSDKLVIPGGIDPSTNFNLNNDHKEILTTGSRLALEGGTTTIINRVTSSDGDNIIGTLQKQCSQLKNQIFCNIAHFVSLNIDDVNCVKDMKEIVQTYGVNCFEINIGSTVTKTIVSVLKECNELGCLLRIRAEDGTFKGMLEQNLVDDGVTGPDGFIQSRLIEDEIQSLYQIMKLNHHCPSALFVPQVMNKDIATIIATMKKNGSTIFCETTTAALVVDGDRYFLSNWEEAASVVTDPPLRTGQTTELIRCLQNGDIDVLASQHTPVSVAERSKGQKDFREIPHGVTGVKERLTMLWDKGVKAGLIDECEFVAVTSANAAKMFNLYPKRGHIAVGSVADLVVWDPEKLSAASTNGHKTEDINIFNGIECKGGPDLVIVNGEIKFQNNTVCQPPTGEKIDLKNNCGVILNKLKRHEQQKQTGKVVIEHKYSTAMNTGSANQSSVNEEHKDGGGTQQSAFTGKTQRPPTSSGNRNMQDSSFAFSGAQIDDDRPNRTSIRTNQPPGGKSSNIF